VIEKGASDHDRHIAHLLGAAERAGASMRAKITVVLDDGTVLEGSASLRPSSGGGNRDAAETEILREGIRGADGLNFSLPLRPFIKAHGTGLSGPRKLTLLLSHIAGGKTDVAVPISEVEKQWSKIEALMGGPYNGAYGIRARDQGWIDSPKRGSFTIRDGWEEVLQ
jgi:hypothetical protein